MKVKITKPDSTLFDGEATLVQLPGTGGLFEIMNNHAPIISALRRGVVRLIDSEGKTQTFDIEGGVVKAQHNDIVILVQ